MDWKADWRIHWFCGYSSDDLVPIYYIDNVSLEISTENCDMKIIAQPVYSCAINVCMQAVAFSLKMAQLHVHIHLHNTLIYTYVYIYTLDDSYFRP